MNTGKAGYAGGFAGYVGSASSTRIATSYCSAGIATNSFSYIGAFGGNVAAGSVTNSYYNSGATDLLAQGQSNKASISYVGITPVAGGILGSTIMMGVKRGIFSNEAGQGSGAMVSAAAAVSHPARQGLAQAFSVYVDTLLVCTATALMILCSGNYNILDAKTGEMLVARAPELGANYVGFTQAAVDSAFTGFGSAFVSIALLFFAFTTVMAYYFYTESSIIYLFSGRNGSVKTERTLIWCYRFLLLAMVIFGSLREANVVWQLGDIGVGLTAWINVLSLLILCPHAIKALKEYESRD